MKKYEAPELELVKFAVEDMIQASAEEELGENDTAIV
jgi:hypothetical protein